MNPIDVLKARAAESPEAPFRGEIITFINPYSYLYFRKHLDLFGEFDRIYFDGIVMVLCARLVGISSTRKSFDMTSLAPEIFRWCQREGKTVYFTGSDPGSITRFVDQIRSAYPRLNILGWRHGYFRQPVERQSVQNEICNLNPDILIVGMGTPLQEEFLAGMQVLGWRGIGFTCGGFIHQTAKNLDYYPKWVDRLNLRWLYRIWDEPKLLKRYLFKYPIFLALFLFDAICWKVGSGYGSGQKKG